MRNSAFPAYNPKRVPVQARAGSGAASEGGSCGSSGPMWIAWSSEGFPCEVTAETGKYFKGYTNRLGGCR